MTSRAPRSVRRAVDSVELKFLVPECDQRMALEKLGIDLHAADVCQVYYLDTPDLDLLTGGVVLRVRRRVQGGDDAAVKLRPVVPTEISRKWRRGDDVSLEIDAAPRLSLCSATFKRPRGRKRLEASLCGDRSLERVFTKRQRMLLAESGRGAIDWPSLRVFGPAVVSKAKTRLHPPGLPLIAELWRYPDGSSLLELSTRVKPRALAPESRRLWGFLEGLGLDVAAVQQTKTEHTLAFFADVEAARTTSDG